MRRITATAALVGLLLAGSLGAQAQQKPPDAPKPIDVTGKWLIALQMEIGQANSRMELKQAGEKLTGTYTSERYGTFELAGTLKGRDIQFTVALNVDGQKAEMAFRGQVADDGLTMKGGLSIEGMGDATWAAKKDTGKG